MYKLSGAGVALVLAALLTACASAEGRVIDKWPIGPRFDCGTATDCTGYLHAAGDALDRRDPGHVGVVDVSLYREADGAAVRTTQCCTVAVFALADGSFRAIGVGENIVGDVIVTQDYGP